MGIINKKKEDQLQLNIKYNNFLAGNKILGSVIDFRKKIEVSPYWKNGFPWLGMLSSLILSFNSFLVIYFNFDKLPNRIAMMFAEKLEEDLVKDKYLLYFLPLITIIIGVSITFLSEKIFDRFPQTTKIISIMIFLMSLIQLIAVYKIINIYL